MSLINDMLRDLDRRERNGRTQGQRILNGLDPVHERKRVKIFSCLAAAAASAVLLLGLGITVHVKRDADQPAAPLHAAIQHDQEGSADSEQAESPLSSPVMASQAPALAQQPESAPLVMADSKAPAEPLATAEKTAPLTDPGTPVQALTVSVQQSAASDEAGGKETGGKEHSSEKSPVTVFRPDQTEAPASGPATLAVADEAQVKTRRVLSFAEQDRETSAAGSAMARRGQLLKAYELLQGHLTENPEAHHTRTTLATLLMAQQDFSRSAALLQQGLALAPHYADYKKLQARLLIRQGKVEEALSLLGNRPPLLEQDVEYHDLLASLYQQAEQHESALSVYRGLLRSDPEEGRWWAAKAISHEAVGEAQEALDSYRKASKCARLANALRRYSNKRIQVLSRKI